MPSGWLDDDIYWERKNFSLPSCVTETAAGGGRRAAAAAAVAGSEERQHGVAHGGRRSERERESARMWRKLYSQCLLMIPTKFAIFLSTWNVLYGKWPNLDRQGEKNRLFFMSLVNLLMPISSFGQLWGRRKAPTKHRVLPQTFQAFLSSPFH